MEDSDPRELMESAKVPEVESPGFPVGEVPPMPDLLDLSDVLAQLEQLSKLDDKRHEPQVRLLSVDEVAKYVEPVFTANNALLPAWDSSFFVGHVDGDGKVIGFITVQAVMHVEPMWVEPGQSHLLPRIISTAVEEIVAIKSHAKVYLTAQDERVVRLCERLGMSREPGTPMTKWLGSLPGAAPDQTPDQARDEPVDAAYEPDETARNEGSE